eukprot:CAMPEP_0203844342 /NCGR_PEP_ID=MMETSP0359-20131031/3138_1 /ASSEMBLY_ACC=CAM_ASM_000338 /TAXON_ID=268821 /ORGANISM="Scrippsiella Hangoei, Strain SHTV-5" /LENGTH=449 /DNA_ID=CAMNT_0050759257 /DNA_START=1 /DNA_END=1350 /DNA_ORIENTATION=-
MAVAAVAVAISVGVAAGLLDGRVVAALGLSVVGVYASRVLACWLAGAPPAKGWLSRARARWLRGQVSAWLRETVTFDGLLAEMALEFEHLGDDGSVRASLVAQGPLLTCDGMLHEGALALLTDTLTSVGQIAAGLLPGLSMQISVTCHGARVQQGERLVAEARILKLYPAASIVSMELQLHRLGSPLEPSSGISPQELVAKGTHLKSFRAPFHVRLLNGLACRCLPLAWLLGRLDLAATRARRLASSTHAPGNAVSLKQLLGLERQDDGSQSIDARYTARVLDRLQNMYGIAHGAAIATLLAECALLHARSMEECSSGEPLLQEMSITYAKPVPGGGLVDLIPSVEVLRKQPTTGCAAASAASVNTRIVVELQVGGDMLARGAFTMQLPEVLKPLALRPGSRLTGFRAPPRLPVGLLQAPQPRGAFAVRGVSAAEASDDQGDGYSSSDD